MCGEVVNKDIHAIECGEQKHASQRRNRHKYCVDCGELLIPKALAMDQTMSSARFAFARNFSFDGLPLS